MFEYRCKLSLWAIHPSDDLSDLSRRLNMPGTRVYRKGEARVTPTERTLTSVHKHSGFYAEIPNEKDCSLPELLRDVLPGLRTHKEVFEEYTSRGVAFSLFVGWFSDGLNSRDVLDWKILADLAELKISLDLDIYGPDEIAPPDRGSY